MKIFLFLLLWSLNLYAIDIGIASLHLSKNIEIFIDPQHNSLPQTILKDAKFFENETGKQDFGYNQHDFWIKAILTNRSTLTQERVLNMNFLPMDYVDCYIYDSNDSLQKHYVSGDLRPISSRVSSNANHIFPLKFAAGETKIILIKMQNSGSVIIDPTLYLASDFWENFYPKQQSFIAAFLAIIAFFTIYNLILFFSLKELSFIYYFLAMGSMFAMQASLFGILYKYFPILGLWNITITANIAGALFILFSVLFVSSYFELSLYIPKLDKIYKKIIITTYTVLIIFLLIPSTYSQILPLVPLGGIIMLFFILVLTYIGFKKSSFSSHYIFLGWLISGSLMFIYLLELFGVLHVKLVNDLTIRVGTLIEMIFFSFALGEKFHFLKEKIAKSEVLVLQTEKQMLLKDKLATTGEAIGNIAHQWRQPLNRLSMIFVKIQSNIYFKQEINKEELLKNAQEAEMTIKDMSHTIDIFLDFFRDAKSNDFFDARDAIQSAIIIIGEALKNNGIELVLKLDHSSMLQGSKAEFSQVVLNLLSNAQNALLCNKVENPFILISSVEESRQLNITIEDNGGGVTLQPIESVFQPYISSGNNKNGSGLGLYIAYNIITQHFNGTIEIENLSHGAKFCIEIPIDQKLTTNKKIYK